MRKILLLLFAIIIFACNNHNQQIIIAGHVNDTTIVVAKLQLPDSLIIDSLKNGNFRFELTPAMKGYMRLELAENILLYANKGDSLNLDIKDKGSVWLSGSGHEESFYLLQKKFKAEELGIADPRMVDIDVVKMDTKLYLAKIDSIRQVQTKLLNQFIKDYPDLDLTFIDKEQKLIEYQWIKQKFEYPECHLLFAKKDAKLPEDYYTFVDKIDFNDSLLLQFPEYQASLKGAVNLITQDIAAEGKDKQLIAKYELYDELIYSEKIFEEIMFQEIRFHIIFKGIEGIDPVYHNFIKRTGNQQHIDNLKRQYSAWDHLKAGRHAPEFELENATGKMFKLSDFRGKIVYIDCWSTKCGKCIEEMPEMKKLVEEMHKNKDIVFITIASDADKDKWRAKLKDFDIPAINLCTGKNYGQFNIDYNAKAMPRYILIGKDGKFIDVMAPGPTKVKEKLLELVTI